MFKKGNFVAFFSTEDNFENLNLNLIEDFIDGCSWYEVLDNVGLNEDWITVKSNQGKEFPILIDEYQIHTKESLRNYLNLLLKQNEANKQYADICKKIKQLYNKQEFKFAT